MMMMMTSLVWRMDYVKPASFRVHSMWNLMAGQWVVSDMKHAKRCPEEQDLATMHLFSLLPWKNIKIGLFCFAVRSSITFAHIHTLRIHQPLLPITDTLTCVLRSVQGDQNVSPLLQKCKQGLVSFSTAALIVPNRNTRNNTNEKKRTAVSVWPHRRPPTGKTVNEVRDDAQYVFGQEDPPKQTFLRRQHKLFATGNIRD
jgi:hypothetical protein